MITSFDNNENKVCLLLKDNVGRSRVKSFARSHDGSYDHKSRDHGVTVKRKEIMICYILIV